MRKEMSAPSVEGEGDVSAEVSAAAAEPMPAPATKPGKLAAIMSLEEPARTDALEKAVHSGMTVNLRSKTDEDVRWRYGEHILVVPPTPKPFTAAHAIHLLFCAPHLVEEVEE